MRWLCLFYLLLLMVLDILPIPVLGLLLVWVIITRPVWFYNMVQKIYDKH